MKESLNDKIIERKGKVIPNEHLNSAHNNITQTIVFRLQMVY